MLCPAGHVALVNPLVPTSRLPHLLLRRVEDDSPALHPVIVRVPWLRFASDRLLLPVHARVDSERDWVSALCFSWLEAGRRASDEGRGSASGGRGTHCPALSMDRVLLLGPWWSVSAVFVKETEQMMQRKTQSLYVDVIYQIAGRSMCACLAEPNG